MAEKILRTLGSIQVERASDGEDDPRTVRFVISDETKDRHDTVIKMDGWRLDNFNANPVVAYQHETGTTDPDNILGSGRAWVEGGVLMGEARFEPADINPKADKIYKKIQHGTLKAVSVGFVPYEVSKGVEKSGEDPDTWYFRDQELLEFSIVNIPSNPKALARAMDDEIQEFIEGLDGEECKRGIAAVEWQKEGNKEVETVEEGGNTDGEKTPALRPISRERMDFLRLKISKHG